MFKMSAIQLKALLNDECKVIDNAGTFLLSDRWKSLKKSVFLGQAREMPIQIKF